MANDLNSDWPRATEDALYGDIKVRVTFTFDATAMLVSLSLDSMAELVAVGSRKAYKFVMQDHSKSKDGRPFLHPDDNITSLVRLDDCSAFGVEVNRLR